jgi:hypothetical protein
MTYKSHAWWLVMYDSQSTFSMKEQLLKGGEGAGREESLVSNGTLTKISPQFNKTLKPLNRLVFKFRRIACENRIF